MLYYVWDKDNKYCMVVKARSKWNARYVAQAYVLNEYNDEVAEWDWHANPLTEQEIVE